MKKNPRTLAAARQDPRVRDAYIDSDGVWIELQTGWGNYWDEPHGGLHGIHEETVKEALQKLRGAAPCHCPSCLDAAAITSK